MPLWKHLSQTYNGGAFDTEVKVYAAGGYYSSTGDGALDDGALREEMQSYLCLLYTSPSPRDRG